MEEAESKRNRWTSGGWGEGLWGGVLCIFWRVSVDKFRLFSPRLVSWAEYFKVVFKGGQRLTRFCRVLCVTYAGWELGRIAKYHQFCLFTLVRIFSPALEGRDRLNFNESNIHVKAEWRRASWKQCLHVLISTLQSWFLVLNSFHFYLSLCCGWEILS